MPVAARTPRPSGCDARSTRSYNEETGRLELLTYDSDDNGVMDVWTYMDGTQILRAEIDNDEDGVIERWEYYDESQQLEKIGFSRGGDGVPDAWAYEGPDGQIERVEVSSLRDGTIDRWEYYDAGIMTRSDEDTRGDGQADKWETFRDGLLVTVAFDENGDGRPDRRLTYGPNGALELIEAEPDGAGEYTRRLRPGS